MISLLFSLSLLAVEQFGGVLSLPFWAGGVRMDSGAREKSAMARGADVGGVGGLVAVLSALQGILNPLIIAYKVLISNALCADNTLQHTECAVSGDRSGRVAEGFKAGGGGDRERGAGPINPIHWCGQNLLALPRLSGVGGCEGGQIDLMGFMRVPNKKKGAAGCAARRVVTAGETALFNIINTHMTMKTEYIALDTETGGTRPGRDALLSIAACTSWDAPKFLVHLLPAPDYRVDPDAVKVNGYSLERWKERGAVSLFQGMEWLQAWLKARFAEKEGARMLAHNAGFDRSFLDEACAITGLKMPVRHAWRCSMDKMGCLMDRGVIGQGKATLSRLGELAGLWPEGGRPVTHEAGHDAEACLHGYLWLLHKEAEEITALKNLYTESVRARNQLEMLLEQANQVIAHGRVDL